MASSKTSYLRKKLLDHALNKAAWVAPTELYLSLHTGDPTISGSLTDEISTSGTNYARQRLDTKLGTVDATTGISLLNDWITTLAALTEWGTITHIGISDAATAGNMLYFGQLTAAQTTTIGQAFQLAPGQLSIQEI